MPEGHTIHRLALDIAKDFENQILKISSPQGRFEDAILVDGLVLLKTKAIGKHLFLEFRSNVIHIHLGLFGKFKRQPQPDMEPRPSVRLRLKNSQSCWDLTGPTACELIDSSQLKSLEARLGADPLSASPRPGHTWRKVHASRRSLGALLLDQSVFAGIGNVYRAELLFMLGIHPETPGRALSKSNFEKLWKLARELLTRGVAANRIVTVKGATRKTNRRETLYVYKQKYCRICEEPIERIVNATRTMYFCGVCQPAFIEQ
jgi:endonuclease VIII